MLPNISVFLTSLHLPIPGFLPITELTKEVYTPPMILVWLATCHTHKTSSEKRKRPGSPHLCSPGIRCLPHSAGKEESGQHSDELHQRARKLHWPEFKPWLHHWLAVWPRARHLTSLYLNFFLYKNGDHKVQTSYDCWNVNERLQKRLWGQNLTQQKHSTSISYYDCCVFNTFPHNKNPYPSTACIMC